MLLYSFFPVFFWLLNRLKLVLLLREILPHQSWKSLSLFSIWHKNKPIVGIMAFQKRCFPRVIINMVYEHCYGHLSSTGLVNLLWLPMKDNTIYKVLIRVQQHSSNILGLCVCWGGIIIDSHAFIFKHPSHGSGPMLFACIRIGL